MKIEDYLKSLPTKKGLSPVKIKILNRLWKSDLTSFPKPWVSSKELLEITGQKYFDRRTRELRDQLGCDIETRYSKELGGHSWRIKSSQLSPPKNREYLAQKDKDKLFERYNYTCAVCGTKTSPGVRGLQADHKKPLSRGGSNKFDNWQPLCHNCNIGKRRACESCELECQSCSWAYPERIGIKTIVDINHEILDKVKNYTQEEDMTLDEFMENAAAYYIKMNKDKDKEKMP